MTVCPPASADDLRCVDCNANMRDSVPYVCPACGGRKFKREHEMKKISSKPRPIEIIMKGHSSVITESVSQAARLSGIGRTHIHACLSGRAGNTSGFDFRYAEVEGCISSMNHQNKPCVRTGHWNDGN
jgi:predicted RNA-binding Zn-ribbon protein involved in translation (DUF1610 family)